MLTGITLIARFTFTPAVLTQQYHSNILTAANNLQYSYLKINIFSLVTSTWVTKTS